MKRAYKLVLFVVLVVLVSACNDTEQLGLLLQPEGDKILLRLDTFPVQTQNGPAIPISAQCDTSSMALGEFYDAKYGSTKAELFIQLSPPVGYKFAPDSLNPTPDSLVLYMYYNKWFGSKTSPLELSIYELNKQSLQYDKTYLSDLNVSDFTDQSILMGKRMVTSVDQTLSDSILEAENYYPVVRYKFSKEQLDRFFNIPHSAYTSQDQFAQHFKGMYITTKYGASTVLYFNQIDLKLFYHYTYKKNGKDTIVNTSVVYPANKEVRQLNKFSNTEVSASEISDSVVYVKSPAGMFPRVTLPIGQIRTKVRGEIGNRLFSVNSAMLVVEATELQTGDLAMPIPEYMTLIRGSKIDDFVTKNHLLQMSDSVAVLGMYNSKTKSYVFDLSYFLNSEIPPHYTKDKTDETLELLLVPSSVSLNSSGAITSIKPLRKMGAVTLRSGTNTESPMRLKVIYSGF
ncbi:MAG TPA: DUF4270 domain-containing protein [Paludibacteraceae bacterium]|nr:DUF4270 domain-containing protein [Paludibacteraceae bacterium]HQB68489.1 DUF4270 domain-containing protein [Paludibacteraceae bacterium]HRS66990.1 DUF4270 domain-containing protein [Paludibacteraceae bacterium]